MRTAPSGSLSILFLRFIEFDKEGPKGKLRAFNSLFEIRQLMESYLIPMGIFTFNSLFEIRVRGWACRLRPPNIRFQFSFWDSQLKSQSKLIGEFYSFQFSFWDSWPRHRRLCMEMNTSFNSLFEIHRPEPPSKQAPEKDFQFSFWDSVLFFGSLGPDSGILFWRGWWKPYSGIHL